MTDEQETNISRLIEEALHAHGYVLGSSHEGSRRVITAENGDSRTVTVVTVARYKEEQKK